MTTPGSVELDLVVPAHDEEDYLEWCVEQLSAVVESLRLTTRIVLVDSGSSDRTWEIARHLAATREDVVAVQVSRPGRGRALKAAWSSSDAALLAYTDVDLSGDPHHLSEMIAMVADGADIVVASRLAKGAQVRRSRRREVLSRAYAQLLTWFAAPPFRDAQCGLKVLRAESCKGLLDEVRDDDWFFDTELLLAAWSTGRKVQEVPVRWSERRDSRVRIVPTILGDLAGLIRVTAAALRRWVRGGADPRAAVPVSAVQREVLRLVLTSAVTLIGPDSPRRTGWWVLAAVAPGCGGSAHEPLGAGRGTPAVDLGIAATLAAGAVAGTRGRGRHRALVVATVALATVGSIRVLALAAWRTASGPACR